MTRILFLSLVFLTSSFEVMAQGIVADTAGTVTMLRGKANYSRQNQTAPITKGMELLSGDKVTTVGKSMVRIKTKDNSVFSVGPNSTFVIQNYQYKEGTIRNTVYNLVEGKLRSAINKKTKKGETVQINSEMVSLGVRGTEILSNAYMVKGNATADTLLLSGKADGFVSGMKGGVVDLGPGQALNSNKAIMEGASSVTKISPETLQALKNSPNAFLPNLQDSLGKFINVEDVLRKGLKLPPLPQAAAAAGAAMGAAAGLASGLAKGAAGLLAGGDSDKEKSKAKEVKKKVKKKVDMMKHKNIIEQSRSVDISKLPRDIQEAYLKRKAMRKEGTCYYWFYKEIPGYGNKERFRRERDCVDFDYDL